MAVPMASRRKSAPLQFFGSRRGLQLFRLGARQVTFRCTRCGSEEAGRLRRSVASRMDEHRGVDAA